MQSDSLVLSTNTSSTVMPLISPSPISPTHPMPILLPSKPHNAPKTKSSSSPTDFSTSTSTSTSTSRAHRRAEPSKYSSDRLWKIPTMLLLTSQQGKAGAVRVQDTSPSTSVGTSGDPTQRKNTTSLLSVKPRHTTKPIGGTDNSQDSCRS